MDNSEQMAEFVFKKNDIAVARVTEPPLITRGKRYTILGIKQAASREIRLRIATDNKKKRYLDASLFLPLAEVLSAEEKEVQEFFKLILNWRKDNAVLHTGKMIHYVPEKGVYVYGRYNDDKTDMVLLNKNKQNTLIETQR